jgi:hypothetical protein
MFVNLEPWWREDRTLIFLRFRHNHNIFDVIVSATSFRPFGSCTADD